jgi:hypothetical protein
MAIISALAIIKPEDMPEDYSTDKKYLVIRIKIVMSTLGSLDPAYSQQIFLIPKKTFNNFDLALLYIDDLANEKGYYNLHENPALENTAIIDEDIYEFIHGIKDEFPMAKEMKREFA